MFMYDARGICACDAAHSNVAHSTCTGDEGIAATTEEKKNPIKSQFVFKASGSAYIRRLARDPSVRKREKMRIRSKDKSHHPSMASTLMHVVALCLYFCLRTACSPRE